MFYDYRSSTFADIKHLETSDPDSETGYRGVYKVAGSYHAKAFKKRVSPVCNSPREAARYAAAWWKGIYGANWPAIFRGRGERGWVMIRDPNGWRLLVSVAHTPGLLGFHRPGMFYIRRDKRGRFASMPRGDTPDYTTPGECLQAYNRWAWGTFGLFLPMAGYYLRRSIAPPVPEPLGY